MDPITHFFQLSDCLGYVQEVVKAHVDIFLVIQWLWILWLWMVVMDIVGQ